MLEEYYKVLRARMNDKRYNHSLNVAKEAAYLAQKYGADVKKAEFAGLLHDITKQTDEIEQLQLISDAGLWLPALELENKKLWHAVSGMAFLKTRLNIEDEDILNAVRYHTTGRARMSLLEKVVFVADITTADRTSPEAKEIRKVVEEDLDKAVCLTALASMEWLTQRKAVVAPNTLAAYNDNVKAFN